MVFTKRVRMSGEQGDNAKKECGPSSDENGGDSFIACSDANLYFSMVCYKVKADEEAASNGCVVWDPDVALPSEDRRGRSVDSGHVQRIPNSVGNRMIAF